MRYIIPPGEGRLNTQSITSTHAMSLKALLALPLCLQLLVLPAQATYHPLVHPQPYAADVNYNLGHEASPTTTSAGAAHEMPPPPPPPLHMVNTSSSASILTEIHTATVTDLQVQTSHETITSQHIVFSHVTVVEKMIQHDTQTVVQTEHVLNFVPTTVVETLPPTTATVHSFVTQHVAIEKPVTVVSVEVVQMYVTSVVSVAETMTVVEQDLSVSTQTDSVVCTKTVENMVEVTKTELKDVVQEVTNVVHMVDTVTAVADAATVHVTHTIYAGSAATQTVQLVSTETLIVSGAPIMQPGPIRVTMSAPPPPPMKPAPPVTLSPVVTSGTADGACKCHCLCPSIFNFAAVPVPSSSGMSSGRMTVPQTIVLAPGGPGALLVFVFFVDIVRSVGYVFAVFWVYDDTEPGPVARCTIVSHLGVNISTLHIVEISRYDLVDCAFLKLDVIVSSDIYVYIVISTAATYHYVNVNVDIDIDINFYIHVVTTIAGGPAAGIVIPVGPAQPVITTAAEIINPGFGDGSMLPLRPITSQSMGGAITIPIGRSIRARACGVASGLPPYPLRNAKLGSRNAASISGSPHTALSIPASPLSRPVTSSTTTPRGSHRPPHTSRGTCTSSSAPLNRPTCHRSTSYGTLTNRSSASRRSVSNMDRKAARHVLYSFVGARFANPNREWVIRLICWAWRPIEQREDFLGQLLPRGLQRHAGGVRREEEGRRVEERGRVAFVQDDNGHGDVRCVLPDEFEHLDVRREHIALVPQHAHQQLAVVVEGDEVLRAGGAVAANVFEAAHLPAAVVGGFDDPLRGAQADERGRVVVVAVERGGGDVSGHCRGAAVVVG
ncbi:LOW QUALITY PROTEIN: hypothetical protein Dda_1260 [Drechslerella dactyloides]|uniref:Uncharacterized protein n=1 Tax=Drechslerella dactyloides TaxID=74499 RepID=A0AAD6NLB5_DREDA|nr:LOW QUALITY PROTEIN: hypothetical protein Dda_1260 [Drechslerella dactyloides]